MSDDILTTTAQEIMALVDELVLDPRVMIRHTLERCVQLPYPSDTQREQARVLMRKFVLPITDLLLADDVVKLRRCCDELEQECGLLARPHPLVTFSRHLTGMIPAMKWEAGWTSEECEALAMYANGGGGEFDRIESFTVNDATLKSGRRVSRAEIREGLRPRGQGVEQYHESRLYQDLVQAHEKAIADTAGRERQRGRERERQRGREPQRLELLRHIQDEIAFHSPEHFGRPKG